MYSPPPSPVIAFLVGLVARLGSAERTRRLRHPPSTQLPRVSPDAERIVPPVASDARKLRGWSSPGAPSAASSRSRPKAAPARRGSPHALQRGCAPRSPYVDLEGVDGGRGSWDRPRALFLANPTPMIDADVLAAGRDSFEDRCLQTTTRNRRSPPWKACARTSRSGAGRAFAAPSAIGVEPPDDPSEALLVRRRRRADLGGTTTCASDAPARDDASAR
jgi:hypothetical protein